MLRSIALKGKDSDKGFILITCYLLIAVLEIFSMALFTRSHSFVQATERNKNKIVALNMAEAGLDSTIAQLASNLNYTGISYTSLGSNGGYQATVCPPTCVGVTAPTDSLVRIVQATGYAPSNVSTAVGYEVRPVIAYVKSTSVAFAKAAFGESSATFSGNATIDSYDSRNGAYGGANVSLNGDVASDGPITMSGNTNIKGDVAGTITQQTGNATYTGSNTSAPSYDCSPATTTLPNLGAMSISGNTTLTLAAGSYHYSSLSITGNGTLSLTGAVTLYVDGTVNIAGNGVGTSGNLPTNLILIETGSSSVSVSGNGNFYGGIYAPNSSVTASGNGVFYGSVFAKDYTDSGNGNIHYDKALKDVSSPCSQMSMLHWRETGTNFNAT